MHTVYINQLLGNVGWKDKEFRHLGCNNNLANSLNLKFPEDIIGLKDSDLPTHTEQDIRFHLENDKLALAGKTIKVVHSYQDLFYFITKKPLKDINERTIGVIYHCQELANPDFFFHLNRMDKKYLLRNKDRSYFNIQSDHNPFQLSQRQKECVFYMLRGKTTKQIAEILNLSKRTVDFYIENIKNKIACHAKSELLIALIEAGYQHIIP